MKRRGRGKAISFHRVRTRVEIQEIAAERRSAAEQLAEAEAFLADRESMFARIVPNRPHCAAP
jgi:hypothetical protein